jgi:hypothetical protein
MPRKSKRLTQRLCLRLRADEFEALEKFAEAESRTASSVARWAIKDVIRDFIPKITVHNPADLQG